MAWDYKNMSTQALKDLESMTACALIRAEVDENIEKYKKCSERLKEIRRELQKRG